MKKFITLSLLALGSHFMSSAQCAISGSSLACIGSYTYLSVDSSTCSSGTWSSSSTTVATVTGYGSYGDVLGVSAGVATITFAPSSGGYSTYTITVAPAPAAISGTSTICDGSTTTLTDATPGGTWSSTATYVATVNPATGAVTGLATGTTEIYYTIPAGCAAGLALTVTSSTLTDSMYGPTSVCSGSSISMYTTATGGVWSSTATAIATVNPSTGIVTGIATGTTTISYTVTGACGTGALTWNVAVNPTTSAGTIYGTSTVAVGGYLSLYDYYASTTGTWYSSNPSVATIDGSGTVTGVTAGTCTIEYVVIGCGSSDTALYTITITPADGVNGNVIFDTTYIGDVKIWLITFNPSTLLLEAYDSTTIYCGGTTIPYSFSGVSTDSYRVKAALYDSTGYLPVTGWVPTYHDSSYHWNTATVFTHTYGTVDVGKNIYMRAGTPTSGPGFISGNVMSGADKGTSGSVPAVNLLMYVYSATTGAQLAQTLTDASGNYSFSNLPVGATYYVYPEAINYATTPYTTITLTSGAPSMTSASFKQHTLSKTITPIPTGLNNVVNNGTTISVYPNPTSGALQLNWNEKVAENAAFTVTDMNGRVVYQSHLSMTAGNGTSTLNLGNLVDGNYVVTVNSNSIHFTNTITISK